MNYSDTPSSILKSQSPNRLFGQMLQEQGKITEEEASQVMLFSKEKGIPFGEAARTLGYITTADIKQTVAQQFGFHYLQPGEGGYPPELYALYEPFEAKAEGLRMLRRQLLECWFEQGKKLLSVAEVHKKNGGSMLTANLAISFSQLGMRTLIVDANLRAPKQQEIFKLSKFPGLTDFITGRNNFGGFLNIPHMKNLFVMTAGTLPPNPQELVGRQSLGNFFETAAERFDVVLVDSPAFLDADEAFTIAARVGGVMLICQPNETRLSDINVVSTRLSNLRAQIVGSVFENQ